jgi:hypothetical protein
MEAKLKISLAGACSKKNYIVDEIKKGPRQKNYVFVYCISETPPALKLLALIRLLLRVSVDSVTCKNTVNSSFVPFQG